MEDRIIYGARWKTLLFLAGAICVVYWVSEFARGVWLAAAELIPALVIVMLVARLIWRTRLVLSSEGFQVRGYLPGSRSYRWADIDSFTLSRGYGSGAWRSTVTWRFLPDRGPMTLSRSMGGGGSLGAGWSMPPEALRDLMNARLAAARGG